MDWLSELKEKYKEDRFFREVFKDGMYAPVEKIEHIGVAIDLGANAGEFSFWIYDKADIIYAIEPHPKVFEELKEIVEKYHLDKIKLCNIALDDKNGISYLHEGGRGGHTLTTEETAIPVETKTLATFMKDEGIEQVDVLKVDIESREKEVFGSPDFPEVASKIKYIIGEHNNGNGSLEQNGFTMDNFHGGWIATR